MSRVERVTYRGKESASLLLDADNMSSRFQKDGTLVVELFRYGKNDRVAESFRFYFQPDDVDHLRENLRPY